MEVSLRSACGLRWFKLFWSSMNDDHSGSAWFRKLLAPSKKENMTGLYCEKYICSYCSPHRDATLGILRKLHKVGNFPTHSTDSVFWPPLIMMRFSETGSQDIFKYDLFFFKTEEEHVPQGDAFFCLRYPDDIPSTFNRVSRA